MSFSWIKYHHPYHFAEKDLYNQSYVFSSERKWSRSVMSHWTVFATPWTVGYQAPPSRNFPSKSIEVGCHFLLQGIFLTQGPHPGLPHCRQTRLQSEPPGKPLMVFPRVTYKCENWIIKNAECRRVMLLNCGAGEDSWRVLWSARRSNQTVLKEINPEYSMEELILKLKLQYFGHFMWRAHLMRRAHWLEKTLMLGKIEGERRRGGRGWEVR